MRSEIEVKCLAIPRRMRSETKVKRLTVPQRMRSEIEVVGWSSPEFLVEGHIWSMRPIEDSYVRISRRALIEVSTSLRIRGKERLDHMLDLIGHIFLNSLLSRDSSHQFFYFSFLSMSGYTNPLSVTMEKVFCSLSIPIYLRTRNSIRDFVRPSIRPSFHLFVRLSVNPSVRPSFGHDQVEKCKCMIVCVPVS